ncbi:putative hydrolase of the HAD superfamily [Kordia periserrulae]|uniref:Putative hydrolase of the HAD superfamily n=1 Tax=Kordia periserrulae TaxID=701523 RepID=A0A2T6C067_9FLAO|nr:HAD family phosphatase [Kordia periserrulae]PTX61709.1 putative hydrolase of the HAD superfamily [Kordia periserrulae]
MIKNIIFDYGDIFINLDKTATNRELLQLGISDFTPEMISKNQAYEKGLITTDEFVDFYHTQFPKATKNQLIDAWNAILLDFPKHRMEFIKNLAKDNNYRLFILSNTNDLHISWIQQDWGMELYTEFKNCFEQFYLSHEIHLRKPDANIYEFVLQQNNLQPEETIFIDDTKENTETAASLGIHTWNLIPGKEDIVDLFTHKKLLF